MSESKYLFETTIPRLVESTDIEKKEENGSTIEIKKTVKKPKSLKVAILKPDRRLYKNAEIFYAKTLADYLKAGLLPYSLVAKRYANDGGPLSEEDKNKLEKLKNDATSLEAEFFTIIGEETEENKNKRNELLIKIQKINSEVNAINNFYADIYDSTADVKSRNDTIEWWSLFLIYIDEDEKGYKSIFGDGDYSARLNKLEEYENKQDEFYNEVIRRLSYLISFWFTARNMVTKIDFKQMEDLFTTTISTYKIEEKPEEVIKVEDKTEVK